SERQKGSGPIQGLNLALLIYTQHQSPVGRIQVEPYDIAHLLFKLGSLEILNFSTRWGWISKRCQTRCTMVRERPRWRARMRTLQCVSPRGLVFNVASKIFCCSSGVRIGDFFFLLLGRLMPSTPLRAKAKRVAITVGRERPVSWAMALLALPW